MPDQVEQVREDMLVMLARQGDRKALESLAARWRPRHYAHARRLAGSHEAAADAVQDAWAAIPGGLRRLREPSRFAAWSYSIVTRKCIDQGRRRARQPIMAGEADDQAAASSDPGDAMDLRRAMAALPPDQRAAIALFYGEDMTTSEIAEALHLPQGTVKTRLFHARRFLRQFLKGDGP